MRHPSVGIVIVTYNAADTIKECLDSINTLTYSPVKAVVVDNGSTDETKKIINKKYRQHTVIENKQNLGFAEANNQGIKLLLKKNCDYILLLNPDAEIKPDGIEHLLKPFVDKTVGVVGPVITYYNSKTIWFAGGFFNKYFCYTRHEKMNQSVEALSNTIRETDFITGCCMMIRGSLFKKIGFLDSRYECYFEDVDFCLRARRARFSTHVVEKPLVRHRVSSSSGVEGSNQLTPFKAYYYGRNPFLLIKNHLDRWRRFTAIIGQFCIRLPFHGLRMLKNGDIRSLISYLQGMRDGLLSTRIFF